MSSSSITNFSIFLAICGAATVYHTASQTASTVKQLVASVGSRLSRGKAIAITDENSRKKKLVVISGCDRGFGYLLTEALLKHKKKDGEDDEDYLVLALALTEKGVQALRSLDDDDDADEQGKNPRRRRRRLVAMQCDVTSEGDVQRVGEAVRGILEERNAMLYSIVNNAGIASGGDFLFYNDIATYQKVMDVNFFGHLRMTQTLLPFMLEASKNLPTTTTSSYHHHHHSRIINISSVCGVSVSPSNSTYNASKYALEAWSDAIRLELEPFHIHVVKIRPGQINTQIQKEWATTYMDNFAKAPPAIQELYGGDAFLKGAQDALDAMGNGSASPPEIVVDALVNSLTMHHSKLQPAYFVGSDAQTFWRALSTLPTSVADSIKRQLRFKYPVAAAASPAKPTEVQSQ